MRLVVAGAAGRMGQMLVKAIAANEGATWPPRWNGPARRPSAMTPAKSRASARSNVKISDDPLAGAAPRRWRDRSTPAATVEIAALAAQARIVHVIGSTGLSADDLEKLDAAPATPRSSAPAT